jgi:hydrogenase maturation protease
MVFHTLVIGCGNVLRGDDGAGHVAADAVAGWEMPGVSVLKVHQLVPELIDDLERAERVLFIDAAANLSDIPFVFGPVEPKKSGRQLGHHESPADLLLMARVCGSRMPPAWQMAISGCSFEHCEGLTQVAHSNVKAALARIHAFLSIAQAVTPQK